MRTLRSHVEGRWHEAGDGFTELVDPCSEEPIARASTAGIDFGRALEHARARGGPALRELTLGARGELLMSISQALRDKRDELIDASLRNTGTTRRDAKFDVDGGIFTLAHYAQLGRTLGDRRTVPDGEGHKLGRSARFWGRHVRVPRRGVAVHVNAYNFPVWGLAEKAACAVLAGMPVITKPATSSALVAEMAFAAALAADGLPEGALSLVCGSTGDLLERLGPQDVLAFTGSADTALKLRSLPNLLRHGTRVNVEADSLNAAVLGPDVEPGSETWGAFVRDVIREMTQKSGQKCTAVRRIVVPAARIDDVQQALAAELGQVVVGNPEDGSVTMGPLATAAQLDDAVSGVARLAAEAEIVLGEGRRIDGVGNPEGKGFFFPPVLLRAASPERAEALHRHEVFGPVATLMPYPGEAEPAAELVGRAEGTLVTSLYSDDREWLAGYLEHGGAVTGRLYIGSRKVVDQLPGSGLVLPALMHGGPGRAGGGEELGDLRGVALYLQRVALSGDRAIVERLAEARDTEETP